MINQEQLMQLLMSQDPAQMEQMAEQLAAQQVPPPPPGSMQQAAGMMAQAVQSPEGLNFGPGQPPQQRLGELLAQQGGPTAQLPDLTQVPQAQVGQVPGELLVNGQPLQQDNDEDRMRRMAIAAQALQPRAPAGGGGQGIYFNPPVMGSAKLAQPLVVPQAITPPGRGVPALGQFL